MIWLGGATNEAGSATLRISPIVSGHTIDDDGLVTLYTVVSNVTYSNGSTGCITVRRRFNEFLKLHEALQLLGRFPLSRFRKDTQGLRRHRARVLSRYVTRAAEAGRAAGTYHPSLLAFLNVKDTTTDLPQRRSERSMPAISLPKQEAPVELAPVDLVGPATANTYDWPFAVLLMVLRLFRAFLSALFTALDAPLDQLETSVSTLTRRPPPIALVPSGKLRVDTEGAPAVPAAPAAPAVLAGKVDGWAQRLQSDALRMSAAAASLNAHLFANLSGEGALGFPLYLVPPEAVESWEVEPPAKKGRPETIVVHLRSRYQLTLENVPNPPPGTTGTFEVTFEKRITCCIQGTSLVQVRGVTTRALPMTMTARIATISLETAAARKLTFNSRVAVLSYSIDIPPEHFSLDAWEAHGKALVP